MKLWLDDILPHPEGWARAYTAEQAIELISSNTVTEISLDHDLGPEEAGTGYDVACFIEKSAAEGWLNKLVWNIHSQNPIGIKNMIAALKSAERFWLGNVAT